MKRFKETHELLANIKGIYEKLYANGEKDSVAAKDLKEDINALERAIRILKNEARLDEDAEAHSEITIEMETGRDISLAEWARRNGIDPSTARQKAGRGGFETARKIGRNWIINENEIKTDKRRKCAQGKAMDRNEILQKLLFKETGRVFSGISIWEEVEQAASEAMEGNHWVTGQDDIFEKWEYYVEVSRNYDPVFEQWETSISLEEIKITEKSTGNETYVKIKGAKI